MRWRYPKSHKIWEFRTRVKADESNVHNAAYLWLVWVIDGSLCSRLRLFTRYLCTNDYIESIYANDIALCILYSLQSIFPHRLFHLISLSFSRHRYLCRAVCSTFVKYRTSSSSSLPTRHRNRLQFLIKIWFENVVVLICSSNSSRRFIHFSFSTTPHLLYRIHFRLYATCTREWDKWKPLEMIECRCVSLRTESLAMTSRDSWCEIMRLRCACVVHVHGANENKMLN